MNFLNFATGQCAETEDGASDVSDVVLQPLQPIEARPSEYMLNTINPWVTVTANLVYQAAPFPPFDASSESEQVRGARPLRLQEGIRSRSACRRHQGLKREETDEETAEGRGRLA